MYRSRSYSLLPFATMCGALAFGFVAALEEVCVSAFAAVLAMPWGATSDVKRETRLQAPQDKLQAAWRIKRERPQLSPHWRMCPSV